jgi:hypothetical protein
MQPIYSEEDLPMPCWKCKKWVEEEIASGPLPYFCAGCSSEASVVEEKSRMQEFIKGLIGLVVLDNGPSVCGKYPSEASQIAAVTRRDKNLLQQLLEENGPLDSRFIELALWELSSELQRRNFSVRQESTITFPTKEPRETVAKVRAHIEEIVDRKLPPMSFSAILFGE